VVEIYECLILGGRNGEKEERRRKGRGKEGDGHTVYHQP
jgi:hypothetical protein